MTLPRFYPILDSSRPMPIVEMARAMTDGGVQFLQIRHKGVWDEQMLVDAADVAQLCERLIINDRADIAKLLGVGLHVGQTDLPPADARRVLGKGIIGFSTHNREQLLHAIHQPIDYLAIGPIFATSSKLNPDPVVGLETIAALRKLTALPLVAIGGITRENAREVLAAGADSVAVIGDVYPENLTALTLRQRVEEWNQLLN